ncbi:MAG: hypothetical protein IJI41_05595 [Anaerolineaceae bacterium]|nr:hypothetical protein [Anaerolineaceae bacterium]
MFDRLIEYINDCTDVRAVLYQQNGRYYIETEYFSDLGEDVVGTVWFDEKKAESLIDALNKTLEDIYDRYDEDLELYIRERPRGTEHFSVRQLVEDEIWKVNFWRKFVSDVTEWYSKFISENN